MKEQLKYVSLPVVYVMKQTSGIKTTTALAHRKEVSATWSLERVSHNLCLFIWAVFHFICYSTAVVWGKSLRKEKLHHLWAYFKSCLWVSPTSRFYIQRLNCKRRRRRGNNDPVQSWVHTRTFFKDTFPSLTRGDSQCSILVVTFISVSLNDMMSLLLLVSRIALTFNTCTHTLM